MSDEDIETISSFVEDFESCIEALRDDTDNELVLNYNFDNSVIDTEDYFYIYEEDGYSKFGFYDLWIYDTQTNILYYFHNNV